MQKQDVTTKTLNFRKAKIVTEEGHENLYAIQMDYPFFLKKKDEIEEGICGDYLICDKKGKRYIVGRDMFQEIFRWR